jgi:hypothetical protein
MIPSKGPKRKTAGGVAGIDSENKCVTCGKVLGQISEYHVKQHQILGCVKPQKQKMTAFFPKASPAPSPLLSLSASKPVQLDGAERAPLPQQPPETLMRATDLTANLEQRNQDTVLTPVAATDQPLYFTRRGLAGGRRRDPGFHVLEWGCTGQDERRQLRANVEDDLTDAQQAGDRYDIIPSGFLTRRVLTLPLNEPRYSFASVDLDEENDRPRLIVRKTTSASYLIQCQTRRTAAGMQYAVWEDKAAADESFWCVSASAAFSQFREREHLCT